jgi:uncharacterized protein YbjT (DUF2867 family)
MKVNHICVLGGTGFVGRHVVRRLSVAGYWVTVLTRRRESNKHLILLPNVRLVECDIYDDEALKNGLAGAEAVINLTGILQEGHGATFNKLHVELPRRLVKLCQSLGVTRVLHMSALKAASDAPSAYLRSKAEGEKAVLASGGNALNVTVFRPSVIFGREDKFLNQFTCMVKMLPLLLLPCPQSRFQPIWVEDVAHAFVESINNLKTFGQSYNLCGPEVYTLRELVQLIADTLGIKCNIVGLGDRPSYVQATIMEFLPLKLMTRDNYLSMQVDSVCGCDFPPLFGFQPKPLEALVSDYFAGNTQRSAYLRFRSKAGR